MMIIANIYGMLPTCWCFKSTILFQTQTIKAWQYHHSHLEYPETAAEPKKNGRREQESYVGKKCNDPSCVSHRENKERELALGNA